MTKEFSISKAFDEKGKEAISQALLRLSLPQGVSVFSSQDEFPKPKHRVIPPFVVIDAALNVENIRRAFHAGALDVAELSYQVEALIADFAPKFQKSAE